MMVGKTVSLMRWKKTVRQNQNGIGYDERKISISFVIVHKKVLKAVDQFCYDF